ncbi:hypothetical protein PPL_03314 [Heterostelium album PN500]|uniref:Thioredoxin-like protein n=1 Tax=Heterostelium pallidum (strain ATCC 26659 / Pp 5 / PN500) TaxID=670386 RepID=D3B4I9_HETP5|nr:hypothetical protein PPL_03314 [Heterostelium album PN500]EFA84237.1 hypothetical protein PPL_03314 [Heterostelium album PN500]|eukprot:XP_020436353.1 hypothetical protein PPL_03314 [Heterostelium album PN500]
MTLPEFISGWTQISNKDDFMFQLTEGDENEVVIVYFGQPNCIACDMVKEYMRTLPGRYPNAYMFQVPFGSPVTKDCMWANDVAIYPFVKVFKNFSKVQNCMGYVTGSGTNMIDDLIKRYYELIRITNL